MRKPRDLNFKVKCPTSNNTAQGEYVQLRVFLLTVRVLPPLLPLE